MADSIDKTRPEFEGIRSFVGTGVSTIDDVLEEQKDLRQMVQDMINEALSNVVGATIISAPDQLTYNFVGGGVSQSELNLLREEFQSTILELSRDLWNYVAWVRNQLGRQLINLQQQIRDLQAGGGQGVKMFRYDTRYTDAGTYNCVQLQWGLSAGVPVWLEPFSATQRCKNILEATGWIYYESTVFFMAVDRPTAVIEGNQSIDIYPVIPVRGVVQKAYVKTTPGATTTLVCYLSKDINGSPTPTEINVSCVIDGGGFLNACVPSVVDGDYIWVQNVLGTWVNVTPFMAVESCP